MSVMPNAPLRDDPLVDERGHAELPAQVFFEDLETSVLDLQPAYSPISSANSPYTASNNEYVLADMSTGDVDILPPPNGRFYISRKGASNALTILATVNGTLNPTVDSDGDSAALAFIGEWRFVS